MQLHAFLFLLIIISTGETLALSGSQCGGHVSLDQAPAGSVTLTLPGGSSRSLCTWLVDVPVGRSVALTLAQVGAGCNVSVGCVGAGGHHRRVLEGEKTLLSGCRGNKASLTWTGAGRSSLQLLYSVQEDERNSSGGRATRRPDQDLVPWSQTGSGFTRTAPVSREEGRGRLYEGSEWSHGPRPVSGSSSEEQEPPRPTTPMRAPAWAERADGETLPLPEEGPNNGADASGRFHHADSPVSAGGGAFPCFHTRHSLSAGTSDTRSTETSPSSHLAETQMAPTDAAAGDCSTTAASHTNKHAVTPTSVHRSSLPELLSRASWDSTEGGAVGEGRRPHSRTSTSAFGSELTPADPVKSHSSSARAETEASAPTSPSRGPGRAPSSAAAHVVSAAGASTLHPNTSPTDSSDSAASEGVRQTSALESSAEFDSTTEPRAPTSSSRSQTSDTQSTASRTCSPNASTLSGATSEETQTATQSTQRDFSNAYKRTSVASSSSSSSSPDATTAGDATSGVASLSSTSRPALPFGDASADATTAAGSHRLLHTHTLAHENPSTDSRPPLPPLPSTHSPTLRTHAVLSDVTHAARTSRPFASSTETWSGHATLTRNTTPVPLHASATVPTASHPPRTRNRLPSPPSAAQTRPLGHFTTTRVPPAPLTSAKPDPEENGETEAVKDESRSLVATSAATAAPSPLSRSPPRPSLLTFTSSGLTSTPAWSSTTSQPPKYYVVPDQPAAIKVETIELLLQIILEDSGSAYDAGLEEDTAAWVGPYLQKAPGFSRLLGVWSSGHAVQNLLEFQTSGALQWLSMTGAAALLERTGLARAVREARSFRSSKITNITLGGEQGDVCDWLLRCPSGFECASRLGTANYTCSSLCRFDYCHHHGICTHHPGQLPVCRCLVGDDFWYMGQRCDVRMTRARLVGACLAILLIIVSVICASALVAVRRYRAILIQAKVDQTRSSYRRFNHFDELSGRFWPRSRAGSADSLDNPAFTRSDELLHLRALDRPCCYHDDTLSLASTCPSHGMRINTIYPHSSQYAWRGSEMSVGDGVLDSGKASDLSVCSWPVEPIQWTPFPLLQQLAAHRTPTVRVSRPRSYCEGMELVDLERSWTA